MSRVFGASGQLGGQSSVIGKILRKRAGTFVALELGEKCLAPLSQEIYRGITGNVVEPCTKTPKTVVARKITPDFHERFLCRIFSDFFSSGEPENECVHARQMTFDKIREGRLVAVQRFVHEFFV